MSESYSGVKFSTVFLKKEIPQHPLLDELKSWCHLFHEKGLAPPYPGGSYGNLSFRTGAHSFIITGTCIGLKDVISNDCFVEVVNCDVTKKEVLINGLRAPSSESFMHWLLYQTRSDMNAVFHGHNELLVKNANTLNIQETPQELPYGTTELAENMAKIMEHTSFGMMKAHGFVALGSDMSEAGNLALQWLKKAEEIGG
jgi:ribulose-5-phosphate 4-epimerase/fuculose-1-phosphate aldolase